MEALLRSSPSTFYTHFSKRLVRYIDVEGQPINLVFQDGSSATCDIILGADGIKSFVRRTMFHTLALAAEERGDYQRAGELHCHKHPAWTGQIAYRCLVSSEELQEKCPGHTSLLRPCIVRTSMWLSFLSLIFCLSIWENIRYDGITRNRHQINETIQHIVTYQMSKGQMINVVALISDPSMRGTTHEGHWSCGATTGELVDQFNGWETPVVDLLQVGSQ